VRLIAWDVPEKTNKMRSLFKRKIEPFKPIERGVLGHFKEAMSADAREILAFQIQNVEWGKRYPPGYADVDFYYSREYRSGVGRRFPNKTLELKLATLRFEVGGDTRPRKVDMYLVQGKFFTLSFRPSAKPIWNRCDISSASVVFHDDPMRPASSLNVFIDAYRPKPDVSWVERLTMQYNSASAAKVRTGDDVSQLLSRFSIALPDDYVDVLRVCDGFSAGKVTVLGAGDLRKVSQEPGDIVVVATYRGGFIGIREGDISGELFYCSNDGKAPVSAGMSFRRALECWMQVHA